MNQYTEEVFVYLGNKLNKRPLGKIVLPKNLLAQYSWRKPYRMKMLMKDGTTKRVSIPGTGDILPD